jgi:hypothetical protein
MVSFWYVVNFLDERLANRRRIDVGHGTIFFSVMLERMKLIEYRARTHVHRSRTLYLLYLYVLHPKGKQDS